MKALVGAFNQEKALVGAFSVIVQPIVEPMGRFTVLVLVQGGEEAELARHHHQHHRHVHQHQTLASLSSSFITDHNRHSMRLHQQLSCVINSVQAASSDS